MVSNSIRHSRIENLQRLYHVVPDNEWQRFNLVRIFIYTIYKKM